MHRLLRTTRFEMYLLVILHFDSALGEGEGVLPYIGYIGMSSVRRTCFLRHFSQKKSIDFGHFGPKLGMVFAL